MPFDLMPKTGVTSDDKDEQARRAVKAFRALQPTLTAYARILTKRKDVRVEMAAESNGMTDGKRIFMRPPIELGENRPHQRRLCDKRDDNKQLLCPACAIREEILATIYHEIAHICCESMSPPTDADMRRMVEDAIRMHGSEYGKTIKARIDHTPEYLKSSFIGLANVISPYLPLIVNAMDDARVNAQQFKARRGTKIMFDADVWKIFNKGVEYVDPSTGHAEHKMWKDYDLNAQVTVGLFCKASGYDYSNFFAPEVVEALDDADLTLLTNQVESAQSASAIYFLSFPVLARLRELGFCKSSLDPEEPKPEPSPEEETGEPSEEEQSSPAEGEEVSHDDSSEPNEEGDSSTGDDDGSGEGSKQDQSPDGTGSESAEGDNEGEAGGESEEGSTGGEDRSDSERDSGDREEDESDDAEAEAEGGSRSDGSQAGQAEPEASESDDGGHQPPDSEQSPSGDDSGQLDSKGSVDEDKLGDADSAGRKDGVGSAPDEREDGASEDQGEAESSDVESGSSVAEGDVSTPKDEEDSTSDAESESPPSSGEPTGGESGEHLDNPESGVVDHDASVDSRPEELSAMPDRDGPDGEASQDDSQSKLSEVSESQDELIDSGADDGTGGVEVIERKENDKRPVIDPEEVNIKLMEWMGHGEKPKSVAEQEADDKKVDQAIIQGLYFETPSRNVNGVREHNFDKPLVIDGKTVGGAWHSRRFNKNRRLVGIDGEFETSETILGPALLKMRVAFTDNARGKEQRNIKSGKVNARVLGRRASVDDERLFKKRTMPGKKSYFVLIGMDVSGSTVGKNLAIEKQAVFAQAELLSRMGIDFAIYAHSGTYHDWNGGRVSGLDLDIYLVKEPHEPWAPVTQNRLASLGPDSCNLDGHTLEYYRKVLDRVTATDKIILYYTDGKMPAENKDEELEILQREIKLCKLRNYTLLGVGIRTDSPIRHGLDTVQIDTEEEVVKVVKHLQSRLLAR